jgi:hypothetical protein
VVERVRLPLWCRTSERAREAVNGGQGRRVLTGQGAAGSACAPGKKPGKLVRAAVEARYRAGRCPRWGQLVLPFHLRG